MLTDLALLVVGGTLMVLLGPVDALLSWLPAMLIAGSAGIFLFYVQHQYEDVYWERHSEWSFAAAALQGSSYLRLPRVLQYFTGNIGLHHVHHMSSQIPNYNLQRAHDEVPAFHAAPVFSLREAVKLTRLKLWDEDAGRMVSIEEARGHASEALPGQAAPRATADSTRNLISILFATDATLPEGVSEVCVRRAMHPARDQSPLWTSPALADT